MSSNTMTTAPQRAAAHVRVDTLQTIWAMRVSDSFMMKMNLACVFVPILIILVILLSFRLLFGRPPPAWGDTSQALPRAQAYCAGAVFAMLLVHCASYSAVQQRSLRTLTVTAIVANAWHLAGFGILEYLHFVPSSGLSEFLAFVVPIGTSQVACTAVFSMACAGCTARQIVFAASMAMTPSLVMLLHPLYDTPVWHQLTFTVGGALFMVAALSVFVSVVTLPPPEVPPPMFQGIAPVRHLRVMRASLVFASVVWMVNDVLAVGSAFQLLPFEHVQPTADAVNMFVMLALGALLELFTLQRMDQRQQLSVLLQNKVHMEEVMASQRSFIRCGMRCCSRATRMLTSSPQVPLPRGPRAPQLRVHGHSAAARLAGAAQQPAPAAA